MEVEDRILLYTVVLGAAFGLFTLLRRRAFGFWVHCVILAGLLVASVGALYLRHTEQIDRQSLTTLAIVIMSIFGVLALLPSVALIGARKMAASRRNGWAALLSACASGLLGFPLPIRRESQFYAALAAAERGDEDECAARLNRLADQGALPSVSGGPLLANVLPPAGARRWNAVLEALEGQHVEGNVLRVIEVRAAAETGDLPRALHAYRALDVRVARGAGVLQQARRAILACAGRTAFLKEALRKELPVMSAPRGAADLILARSLEAEGVVAESLTHYQRATRSCHGRFQRDALDGITRCETGRPRLALGMGLDLEQILDLEDDCRSEAPHDVPSVTPAAQSATLWIAAVTTLATVLAWTLTGDEFDGLLASGALSAPLIMDDGEWWRLFTTMFLHGGVVHLLMNIGSILVVGIPLERRIGAARTLVIYVLSGVLASVGSVVVNATDLGVGASGAAMGLFGAFGALLLLRRELFHPAERTRWLNVLWVTTIATAALGALEHEAIDNAAHGIGLVAGGLIAWGLLRSRRPAGLALWTTAVVLVLAQACATVVTVRSAPQWLTERSVQTSGVWLRLPAWMHVRASSSGVIAARPPAEIRLLFGVIGRHPDDAAPLLEGLGRPELLDALAAGPIATREDARPIGGRIVPVDIARFEFDADGSDQPGRFELIRIERRGAFALVYLPIPPDDQGGSQAAWMSYGRTLSAILGSLRAVDG